MTNLRASVFSLQSSEYHRTDTVPRRRSETDFVVTEPTTGDLVLSLELMFGAAAQVPGAERQKEDRDRYRQEITAQIFAVQRAPVSHPADSNWIAMINLSREGCHHANDQRLL